MTDRYQGILNINKPAGWTSHDVVARVRRICEQRTAGHAGTLDPLATGVLLVCVGQATRLSEYLMAGEKVYRALIRLGATTDTYDDAGHVTATAPVPDLSPADLTTALAAFTGDIMQAPPAYSAIKQDGVPLHRRARRGQEVELVPRPVTIRKIELLDWRSPDLSISVTCSPGTYVRSLAFDLGQALGCGAFLAGLVRLRSGNFSIDDAVTLETLAVAAAAGGLAGYLHPLESALGRLTPVPVDETAALRLRHGQPVPCPVTPDTELGYARLAGGQVLAILRWRSAQWWPEKVFATAEDVLGNETGMTAPRPANGGR
jgi:tRNA pseudouridine55 synthase